MVTIFTIVVQHPEKHQEADQPHQHSLKQTESQRLLTGSPHKQDPDAGNTPEPCHATPVPTGGKAPFTPAIHALPPLPPLLFCPLKGAPARSRATPLRSYVRWAYPGLRPGLSIRVVRAEIITSMPAVTEYIVHVEDLHTKVFWIAKKRFHEFYLLRKKVRHAKQRASDCAAVMLCLSCFRPVFFSHAISKILCCLIRLS